MHFSLYTINSMHRRVIFYLPLMRKSFLAVAVSAAVLGTGVLISCGLHDPFDLNLPTSENDIVSALQESLVLGSKTAANNLSDGSCGANLASAGECATGYLGNKLVEIALPDTIKDVLSKINSLTSSLNSLPSPVQSALLKAVGSDYSAIFSLGGYGDSIKTALNRGAEQAAPKSVDVFKNAIFGMSFSDARGVLLGDSVAATTYLHKTTYNGLQGAFSPILKGALDVLEPNKYWSPLAGKYNSFAKAYSGLMANLQGGNNLSGGFTNLAVSSALSMSGLSLSGLPELPYGELPTDISGELSTYATGKALNGLFLMVGKQETALRADPLGAVKNAAGFITDTVGELLSDVFGKAKNGLI